MKQKLLTDAMYKLEHESKDTKKSQKVAPALSRLEEIRHSWNDDFALNQLLRNRFRDEKKELKSDEVGVKILNDFIGALVFINSLQRTPEVGKLR